MASMSNKNEFNQMLDTLFENYSYNDLKKDLAERKQLLDEKSDMVNKSIKHWKKQIKRLQSPDNKNEKTIKRIKDHMKKLINDLNKQKKELSIMEKYLDKKEMNKQSKDKKQVKLHQLGKSIKESPKKLLNKISKNFSRNLNYNSDNKQKEEQKTKGNDLTQ